MSSLSIETQPAPAAPRARTIRLHPADDVVVAVEQLVGGTLIDDEGVTVAGLIPAGHKIATRAIAAGAPVHRYGQIIGFASQPIRPGQHVHTHNLDMGEFARDYAFGAGAGATDFVPDAQRATSFGAFFFLSGIAALVASLAAGLIWDRDGSSMTFTASAAAAALAAAMLWLLPEEALKAD